MYFHLMKWLEEFLHAIIVPKERMARITYIKIYVSSPLSHCDNENENESDINWKEITYISVLLHLTPRDDDYGFTAKKMKCLRIIRTICEKNVIILFASQWTVVVNIVICVFICILLYVTYVTLL
ncbi:UNVERIFIED_CONTAM: hypothetical protein NCL1_17436 [Trichonephila clavipes]